MNVVTTTVVSEKKGTFIYELILERYKYLRNTQKRPKVTNYDRNKSFIILSSLQWCLFETSRIINLVSLCVKLGG